MTKILQTSLTLTIVIKGSAAPHIYRQNFHISYPFDSGLALLRH